MGNAAELRRMTADDFLKWDCTQTVKHEFVDGEIFAMAGAQEAHVTLTLNLAMALRQHLAGTPCRTLTNDMKLRVDAANAYFYPDVLVTCSPADAANPLVKREPLLVVEVLSPTTAAFDRDAKFGFYRLLPSLQEYLLVDPQRRRSDLYRKNADGLWVLHPGGPEEGVSLASVALDVSAAALWAEVPHVDPGPLSAPE